MMARMFNDGSGTGNRWTNQNNYLWRVFPDGREEVCNYAGISHLAAGSDEPARIPCIYCGSVIPGTRNSCPNCGAPRLMLIASCRVEIKAVLPQGGKLMDLNGRSTLEVRRKGWRFWDNPYFVDGGLSVRSSTRYAVRASQTGNTAIELSNTERNPESVVVKQQEDEEQTIIRMTEFNLLTMYIDSPVPLVMSEVASLMLTMMLECKAEFFFGEER